MSSSSLTPALSECETDDLLKLVASVPDPRRGGARVHPVGFVLAVVLVAFTSPGFATLTGAGQLAAAWPRRVLLRLGARPLLPDGRVRPPSEATIRRIVSAVDPQALQGVLDAWTARLRRRHGLRASANRSADAW